MIPGLYYFPNIIPDDLRKEIENYLTNTDDWFSVGNASNSRKVIHYGFKYDYISGDVSEPTSSFPSFANKLVELIKNTVEFACEEDSNFVQCLINKYEDNQGIGSHIDSLKYGRYICCFTLGSGANLTFTKVDSGNLSQNNTNYEKSINLYTEPNSLYIMSGEARYFWKHEMKKLKSDIVNGKRIPRGTRISITFRSIKK